MSIINKNKRLLLFALVIFVQIFYLNTLFYDYDVTWEYGLCHAFVNGEIPYLDFNLITTPLYLFLFSIGLFIKDSFIVVLIENFILNIVVFYFVDMILGKKSIMYIFSLCGFCFFAILPTYNSLFFLLLILVICFEKLGYSDKIIGFFWGLLILSKHTIGLPIVFITIIGLIIKRYGFRKIIKRIFFMCIPLILFLIYLIITRSFTSFFDLCILGLFDFASHNSLFSIYFLISILLLIISIFWSVKNRNNLILYYLIGSFMFVVPIFDKSHIAYYIVFFIFICCCCDVIKIKDNKRIYFLLIICLIISYFFNQASYRKNSFSKLNHYDYIFLNSEFVTSLKLIHKDISKYDNYHFIDEFGMFYDIVYDRKITYYDLPHYGNYGYNGVNKMLKRIENENDCFFVIREDYVGNQIVHEAIDYISNNYNKVDSIGVFSIYYKE